MMRPRNLIRTVATIVATLALATVTFAQDAPKPFEKMTAGAPGGESLPAAQLVYAAYAAVWVVLLTYVFILWRRATRLEQALAAVNDRLDKR
jgi:CcmD family protein